MNIMFKNKKNSRGSIVPPVLFVVIAFGILLTSGALVNKSPTNSSERYEEVVENSKSSKKNLQLKDLSFKVLPTIIPSSACNHDNGLPIKNSGEKYDPNSPDACKCDEYVIECKAQKCVGFITEFGKPVPPPASGPVCGIRQAEFDNWCTLDFLTKKTDGTYCLGKPVIYLYPEYPMLVDVKVKTAGKVVVSDPQIEYSNKWTRVLAHPNGILFYKDQAYRELFYETESQTLTPPQKGMVVKIENLKKDLLSFITQLGLTRKDEQNEFLEWWIPRLEALNAPYTFVSILENDEKQRLDQVIIEPQPDTFIEFIVYFKPLEKFENVEQLVLPPTPERKGFTAIEWGGVIDH